MFKYVFFFMFAVLVQQIELFLALFIQAKTSRPKKKQTNKQNKPPQQLMVPRKSLSQRCWKKKGKKQKTKNTTKQNKNKNKTTQKNKQTNKQKTY